MRYISHNRNLALVTVDGTVKYLFRNGVLDLGSGNEIQPDLSGVATSKLFDFSGTPWNADDTSDLTKCGLGWMFWESEIEAASSITIDATPAGQAYKVTTGPVVYNSTTYQTGERFLSVTGQTTCSGAGYVCPDIPPEYYVPDEVQFRKENFKVKHLAKGNETAWSEDTYGAPAQEPGVDL